MKIMVYEARADERKELERQSRELGVELSISEEVPTVDNAALAAGCLGVSTLGQGRLNAQLLDAYKAAIEGARSEEDNEYNTILTSSDDDMAELIFGLLNVSEEDMTAYAISVSAMNVRAYGVAAILPAAGKEDLVLEGLNSFVENQKRSFEQYLADQYDIASHARLDTLADGTVLLVMCEDQDEVFNSIRDAIEET